MSNISLIVGLGNPGSEYAQTRHNAGFWFVEQLADKYGITLKNDPKFHGISGRGNIEGHDVRLLLPTDLYESFRTKCCSFLKVLSNCS